MVPKQLGEFCDTYTLILFVCWSKMKLVLFDCHDL